MIRSGREGFGRCGALGHGMDRWRRLGGARFGKVRYGRDRQVI